MEVCLEAEPPLVDTGGGRQRRCALSIEDVRLGARP